MNIRDLAAIECVRWSLPTDATARQEEQSGPWGSRVYSSPWLAADSVRVAATAILAGQRLVRPATDSATVIVAQRGELAYADDSGFTTDISARDILSVPPGRAVTLVNYDVGPAAVYSMISELHDDPGQRVLADLDHMRWSAYRREFHWNLPLADQNGMHRAPFPLTPSPMVKGHTNWVPPGQGSPWHSVPRDLVFFVLDGTVEIRAANTVHDLSPCDLLLVRANTPFAYRNPGNADAFYFDGGGPVRQAEATNVYYESDPGWPVDPAVAVTFTRRDGVTQAAVTDRQ